MQLQTSQESHLIPSQAEAARFAILAGNDVASIGGRFHIRFQKHIAGRQFLNPCGGGTRHAFRIGSHNAAKRCNVNRRLRETLLCSRILGKLCIGPIGAIAHDTVAGIGNDQPQNVDAFHRNDNLFCRVILAHHAAIEHLLVVCKHLENHTALCLAALPLQANLALERFVKPVQGNDHFAAGMMTQPVLIFFVLDTQLSARSTGRLNGRIHSKLTPRLRRADQIAQLIRKIQRLRLSRLTARHARHPEHAQTNSQNPCFPQFEFYMHLNDPCKT